MQPHSGSQANTAVYFSVLQPGDRILTMDLAMAATSPTATRQISPDASTKSSHYGVSQTDERIDYDALAKLAVEVEAEDDHRRRQRLSARSSTSSACAQIADSVGAYLFVDMAHIAGLVAGGHAPESRAASPISSPRPRTRACAARAAASSSARRSTRKAIDSQVFPGIQGGPLEHVIAAKAVCFHEALRARIQDYAAANRQATPKPSPRASPHHGYRIVSGGTDNHLMLVDLRPNGLNGKVAQETLDHAGITVNKNGIPFDTEPISKGGGIRVGTPAVTTRGMKEEEMMDIADLMHRALGAIENPTELAKIRDDVRNFTRKFPLPF